MTRFDAFCAKDEVKIGIRASSGFQVHYGREKEEGNGKSERRRDDGGEKEDERQRWL